MTDQSPPSLFADIELAQPVAVFQLTADYKKDSFDKKINLGVGGMLYVNVGIIKFGVSLSISCPLFFFWEALQPVYEHVLSSHA